MLHRDAGAGGLLASAVPDEEMFDLGESRERAQKRVREIFGEDCDGPGE